MTTNDVAKLLKLNKDMYQHSDRPFTDDTLAVWLTVNADTKALRRFTDLSRKGAG